MNTTFTITRKTQAPVDFEVSWEHQEAGLRVAVQSVIQCQIVSPGTKLLELHLLRAAQELIAGRIGALER